MPFGGGEGWELKHFTHVFLGEYIQKTRNTSLYSETLHTQFISFYLFVLKLGDNVFSIYFESLESPYLDKQKIQLFSTYNQVKP